MSYCRKLLFLLLMHIVINVGATHIVGGVVYYEYLGGNRYKIIFEVYRDCSSNVSIGYEAVHQVILDANYRHFILVYTKAI